MNTIIRYLPLIYLGAGAVAVFYIIRELKPGLAQVDKLIEKGGENLAEKIVGPPIPIADASKLVALPNGQVITWDQVTAAGSSLKSDNTFFWQGVRYRVTGRGNDGKWQTALA